MASEYLNLLPDNRSSESTFETIMSTSPSQFETLIGVELAEHRSAASVVKLWILGSEICDRNLKYDTIAVKRVTCLNRTYINFLLAVQIIYSVQLYIKLWNHVDKFY